MAELQERSGWPERAAAVRAHATRARELSKRAREDLAVYQAQATAAKAEAVKAPTRPSRPSS